MRSLDDWLSAYEESHRNPTNEAIHFVCVPAIMWSVLGLLFTLRPASTPYWWANAATVVGGLGCLYYFTLSPVLGLVMFAVVGGMLGLCQALTQVLATPLWMVALGVFIVAWAGQFWGHKIEGKKPSFSMDIQFLLIGPLWVLANILGRTPKRTAAQTTPASTAKP